MCPERWQERKLYQTFKQSLNTVNPKPEYIVLEEEGISQRFEDKRLGEGVGRIIICFELTEHIYQNSTIKHRLTINFCNNVLNLLEGKALQ